MAARVRVALFGGSFNPPHVGHVLAVAYVLGMQLVDRVLVVPVFEHALRKHLEPFADRLEMARRAFGWLPSVEVSDIEARLAAPSRTLRTILALEGEQPTWDLRLMVGSDILGEIHQWHAFDEVARRAPLLVLPRAGATPGAAKPLLPEVSSSAVRELLARQQRSPATPAVATGEAPEAGSELGQLHALVPPGVLEYVRQRQLYRC